MVEGSHAVHLGLSSFNTDVPDERGYACRVTLFGRKVFLILIVELVILSIYFAWYLGQRPKRASSLKVRRAIRGLSKEEEKWVMSMVQRGNKSIGIGPANFVVISGLVESGIMIITQSDKDNRPIAAKIDDRAWSIFERLQ